MLQSLNLSCHVGRKKRLVDNWDCKHTDRIQILWRCSVGIALKKEVLVILVISDILAILFNGRLE
jgi:hypothetical protein